MMRTFLNYLSFVFAGVLLLLGAAIIHFWPASWWFEVRSIRVFDARSGKPVIMAVDRSINRDFRGEWVASIRITQNGQWVNFCTARGITNYAADSALPDPLTLKWWTFPDCSPLPPGKYLMRTEWVVQGAGLLPNKSVRADSNIFEIIP